MKLSILFIAATEAKKLLPPVDQLTKIRGHIDFVWEEWYGACDEKRIKKRDRFHAFVDKIELAYLDGGCGYFDPSVENGGPRPSRKRRDVQTGVEGEQEVDYLVDEECVGDKCRLSKTSKNKAVKQIGDIISRFSQAHMAECTDSFSTKIKKRATRWTLKLQKMKCAGGNGIDVPEW